MPITITGVCFEVLVPHPSDSILGIKHSQIYLEMSLLPGTQKACQGGLTFNKCSHLCLGNEQEIILLQLKHQLEIFFLN